MESEAAIAELREFFTEWLGPKPAAELTRLARPGFGLTEADRARATGRWRREGVALLEPESPWPHCEDHPLTLLAEGWPDRPGQVAADDIAFGHGEYPTGGSPRHPKAPGVAERDWRHLLQLGGPGWRLGGEGGWMHWSVPRDALYRADSTAARPTPDFW
ncbi:hypothetical protein AB0I28_06520 [Phytomonospora sp. NPDC050363]|uniref:hypothetical protein n=1 Tax=Phytomonospora sp. NPDC050363 TaxID=3155642 RepID=UPI0034028D16